MIDPYRFAAGAAAEALRIAAIQGLLTESGNGADGWNYTVDVGAGTTGGVLDKHVAAAVDFTAQFTINHTTPGGTNKTVYLGLATASGWTNNYTDGFVYGLSCMGGDKKLYLLEGSNAFDSGMLALQGDTIRIKRVGTTLSVGRQVGSEGAFTDYAYFQPSVVNVAYYLNLVFGNTPGTSAFNLRGTGLV